MSSIFFAAVWGALLGDPSKISPDKAACLDTEKTLDMNARGNQEIFRVGFSKKGKKSLDIGLKCC
ncbi:MAG: hypothetical protein QG552_3580 [Thermodesulfobacteriota bacterium]|nr:hypothetical protein [Thermodesulfobacteriota bacterium]